MVFYGRERESPSIRGYYRGIQSAVRETLQQEEDEYILGVDTEEYADFLYETYALPLLEKDPSRDIQANQTRLTEDVRDEISGRFVSREETGIRVEYPLVPGEKNKQALDLVPSRFRYGSRPITYDEHQAIIVFETRTSEEDLSRSKGCLEEWLSWRNDDIEEGNAQLKPRILAAIQQRKQQLAEQKDQFESILQKVNVKLKPRPGSESRMVDLKVKRQIQAMREPPEARRPEEWVLDREQVLAVVDVIDRTGRGFETTPLSYSKFEEEDLRNVILGNLNTIFEGGATGETFSKKGKTDIYLVIPKGGILVAECKYWDGPKAHAGAIDQLFDYLTWRDTYGIVVTFSRNKHFTNVLDQADKAIQAHATYQAGFSKIGETHFESIHVHPEDRARTVEVHHLFYTLYVET